MTELAERPRTFTIQMFGGRWDGAVRELEALPARLVIPIEGDEDHNDVYVRADWTPREYEEHGYMRYNHKDGGYYGQPYGKHDGDSGVL